jgi:hypothetical protein
MELDLRKELVAVVMVAAVAKEVHLAKVLAVKQVEKRESVK